MSKKHDKKIKELTSNLQNLGLSAKESAVYVALLPISEVGSSKIIHATGLHGQYVYDALASLEEKGLVRHAIVRGRKKFSANSPKKLASLAERKLKVAETTATELENFYPKAHEQDFEVYQGDEAFLAHEFDLLERAEVGSFVDLIGGVGSRFAEILEEREGEYSDLRTNKKIHFRYIGSVSEEKFLRETKKNNEYFSYRLMTGLEQGITNTVIRPEYVSFVTYGTPVLIYTVHNQGIAQSHRNFFNALWRMCD